MTRVEQLERQIVQLNPEEFIQLREWLLERNVAESLDQNSPDSLSALLEEFDRELAVLHRPGASEKLQTIFASTPVEIAEAANAANQRKG